MRVILNLWLCLFVWNQTCAIPAELMKTPDQAKGPPIANKNGNVFTKSEPQPPSIEGIEFGLRAPAPPEDLGPQPPAPPDPALLELFETDPIAFAALFNDNEKKISKNQKQTRVGSKQKRDANQQQQSRSPTYDQFLTAVVISGYDLRNRIYTMFAPDDRFFAHLNLSLPLLALKDKNCVAQIVRSHMTKGKLPLVEGGEDVTLSLQEMPVFYTIKEVNGATVVRANIETDYGIVHIVDRLIDREKVIEECPSLNQLRSGQSEGQVQHSINQRKISELDEFYVQESDNSNTIGSFFDETVHESVDPDVYEYAFPENE